MDGWRKATAVVMMMMTLRMTLGHNDDDIDFFVGALKLIWEKVACLSQKTLTLLPTTIEICMLHASNAPHATLLQHQQQQQLSHTKQVNCNFVYMVNY